MDAPGGVGGLMQHVVGRDTALTSLTDQNVLGIDDMRQRVYHLIVVIEQFYLDFNGVFRKGYKEHVLKGFLHMLGLFCDEPFLERVEKECR